MERMGGGVGESAKRTFEGQCRVWTNARLISCRLPPRVVEMRCLNREVGKSRF